MRHTLKLQLGSDEPPPRAAPSLASLAGGADGTDGADGANDTAVQPWAANAVARPDGDAAAKGSTFRREKGGIPRWLRPTNEPYVLIKLIREKFTSETTGTFASCHSCFAQAST